VTNLDTIPPANIVNFTVEILATIPLKPNFLWHQLLLTNGSIARIEGGVLQGFRACLFQLIDYIIWIVVEII
jgi:hypothetical protein